jgi:hypothetical protein
MQLPASWWRLAQNSGGRTIHEPSVDNTKSPTPVALVDMSMSSENGRLSWPKPPPPRTRRER